MATSRTLMVSIPAMFVSITLISAQEVRNPGKANPCRERTLSLATEKCVAMRCSRCRPQ